MFLLCRQAAGAERTAIRPRLATRECQQCLRSNRPRHLRPLGLTTSIAHPRSQDEIDARRLKSAIPDYVCAHMQTSTAHPAAAMSVLTAACWSRSWNVPHVVHRHCLTDNPASPVGPVGSPHTQQVLVESFDAISKYFVPLWGDLYESIL